MTNIKLRGEDILGMVLTDLKQAEDLIAQAEHMEGYAFWMKGKGCKAIHIFIKKEKGMSLGDYYKNQPTGRISQTHAIRLISAFEMVEEMMADGVPLDELPKTEHECRVLRLGKEQRMRPRKAEAKAFMLEAREAKKDVLEDYPDEVAEILNEETPGLIEKKPTKKQKQETLLRETIDIGNKFLINLDAIKHFIDQFEHIQIEDRNAAVQITALLRKVVKISEDLLRKAK